MQIAPLSSRATRRRRRSGPRASSRKRPAPPSPFWRFCRRRPSPGRPISPTTPSPSIISAGSSTPSPRAARANGETSGVAPSCDCNYGILPDVQLHIQPGAAFRRASGASPAWGPGDTELGLKYRFVEQDKTNATPSIAFYPLLEAPTGDPTRGLGARANPRPAAVLGPKGFWRLVDFRGRRLLDQSRSRRQKQLVRRLGLATQAHGAIGGRPRTVPPNADRNPRLSVDRLQRRRDL